MWRRCWKLSYKGILVITKLALCGLNFDYLFSSCSLLWYREDAPETLPSQTPPASKILKGETESKATGTPAQAARRRAAGGNARETGGEEDGTEPVSRQSRDESGCSPEQQPRQEGGLISKSDREDFHFYLRELKEQSSALIFDYHRKADYTRLPPRSPNKLLWQAGLKPTGWLVLPWSQSPRFFASMELIQPHALQQQQQKHHTNPYWGVVYCRLRRQGADESTVLIAQIISFCRSRVFIPQSVLGESEVSLEAAGGSQWHRHQCGCCWQPGGFWKVKRHVICITDGQSEQTT